MANRKVIYYFVRFKPNSVFHVPWLFGPDSLMLLIWVDKTDFIIYVYVLSEIYQENWKQDADRHTFLLKMCKKLETGLSTISFLRRG